MGLYWTSIQRRTKSIKIPNWIASSILPSPEAGPSSPRAEYVARELKQELTTAFRYYDPASLGELTIELSMPKLPLVGQSADVILDVSSPHSAFPINASFGLDFTGDVEILSSDSSHEL